MYDNDLYQQGLEAIKSLSDENGILASSRSEMFGCVFGRDSAITGLTLLTVFEKTQEPVLFEIVQRIIFALSRLQGRGVNIESGEEPGKCIHEYRPTDHDHLTSPVKSGENKPWHVYDDGVMRIFDTVDATPLYLILVSRFIEIMGDYSILNVIGSNVSLALMWLLAYADTNNDGLIDYQLHPDRKCGGLAVQSWMDSGESTFFDDSNHRPQYPIAPVEAQAYAYSALRAWSHHFGTAGTELPATLLDTVFANTLDERATLLRQVFNKTYPIISHGRAMLAYAIDGKGNKLTACRSTMGHVLWADFRGDCIIDCPQLKQQIVDRMMQADMFVRNVGLRTLSQASARFDALSYHNGSIWPHDTGIAAEGMRKHGFYQEADLLIQGLKKVYEHFKTPIELFVSNEHGLGEYSHENGSRACMVQAWSAATMMAASLFGQNLRSNETFASGHG